MPNLLITDRTKMLLLLYSGLRGGLLLCTGECNTRDAVRDTGLSVRTHTRLAGRRGFEAARAGRRLRNRALCSREGRRYGMRRFPEAFSRKGRKADAGTAKVGVRKRLKFKCFINFRLV